MLSEQVTRIMFRSDQNPHSVLIIAAVGRRELLIYQQSWQSWDEERCEDSPKTCRRKDSTPQHSILQYLLLIYFAVRPSCIGEALKVLVTVFCCTCPQRKSHALHHSRCHVAGVTLAKSDSFQRSHQSLQQMVLLLGFGNLSRLCEGDRTSANQDYCRTK